MNNALNSKLIPCEIGALLSNSSYSVNNTIKKIYTNKTLE